MPSHRPTHNSARESADELELKLQLPDGAIEALPLAPLLKDSPPRTTRLDATYFDTADRLLQKHGMALRLRRSGRRWLQTLKAAGTARGGLSTRLEWEFPAKLIRGAPRIDLGLLKDSPLPDLLSKHVKSGSLQPVFKVRVTRTLWDVSYKRSRFEVAMDRGQIESSRTGRRSVEAVAELELELKEGRAGDLLSAALRLVGTGTSSLALVPTLESKAERGYRLVTGEPRSPTKAAAKGFVDSLKPDMSVGVALRAIIAHGLDVLLANTYGLRDAQDPEYVHQARVALRRMRSAVRLLDRSHADFPAALAKDLRWVGRLLGDARDWDVLAGETLPAFATAAPPELAPQAHLLLDQARNKRDAARTAATAALATPRYARLALRLQSWTLTPAPAGRILARVAPRVLGKAHAQLFSAAQFFAALSPERRHRVRIFAKRLRYSLDVMSVALPKQSTERFVAALSELQDVLGTLNDAAVANGVLRDITDSEAALDFAQRWAEAHVKTAIGEAEVLLLKLLETRPPWKA
jgi:inorganic triphosphatase YgiF